MRPPDDIAAFLAGLNAPEPEIVKAQPTGQPDKSAGPRPFEDAGLDTRNNSITTRASKRVFMNDPGIENGIAQIRRLPDPEETFHSIMGGDFHGFDIIPTIQRLSGKPLTGLRIATLGFNKKNNLQLCQMHDDGLVTGPITVLASRYFAQTDGKTFSAAKEEIERRGGSLSSSMNHAKIIATQTGDAFIVIETSANLRSCNALEQFTITNSEPLYRWHCQWIDQVAARHRNGEYYSQKKPKP